MSTDLQNDGFNPEIVSVGNFSASELFSKTFEDGMAMVEEAAAYLDGPGRIESRELGRKAALAYAGESMRLTTRLMQVASWLLVQRAIGEGEMAAKEANAEKYRLGAREICLGRKLEAHDFLPERLQDLLVRSENLYHRVDRLDELLYKDSTHLANAVAEQIGMLQARFGAAE
jgi:regulator of CtrA degradation